MSTVPFTLGEPRDTHILGVWVELPAIVRVTRRAQTDRTEATYTVVADPEGILEVCYLEEGGILLFRYQADSEPQRIVANVDGFPYDSRLHVEPTVVIELTVAIRMDVDTSGARVILEEQR